MCDPPQPASQPVFEALVRLCVASDATVRRAALGLFASAAKGARPVLEKLAPRAIEGFAAALSSWDEDAAGRELEQLAAAPPAAAPEPAAAKG
jgi:hypothetical protein